MDTRIETTRLILRPFMESDAAAVKYFAENEYKTETAALEWIRWISKIPGKRPDTSRLLIMFAIELRKTGECIGRVYIHSKVELDCEVEIGYCISKQHRNKGFATEAVKAAVWFAFERAEQDVLAAIVKPENVAFRRVIEKLGFVSGGVRTVLDDDGEYFDLAVSVQTMHHFVQEQKTGIYRNIHKALKPGGCYIESDFYVDAIAMEQYRRRYKAILSQAPEQVEAGTYHIDIPNTIEIQRQLLSDSGFQTVEVLESHIRPRWSGGILKAGK